MGQRRDPSVDVLAVLSRCMHVPPQIEGRGNGIKTNVVNNVDIAKALERPPECEFACGSSSSSSCCGGSARQ